MTDYIPKWHRELEIFSKIKPLIILEGNVLDVYQYPGGGGILRLPQYLHYYFKELGYRCIAFFDSMQGFYNPCENACLEEFARLTGTSNAGSLKQAEFKGRANNAAALTRAALNQSEVPTVAVLNLASRYIVAPDRVDQAEVDSFTSLQLASLESRDVRTDMGALKNLALLIVNKSNDLPVWFHHDNPNARIITLGTPAKEEREQLIKGPNFASFFNSAVYSEDIVHYEKHPDELAKIQDKFVGLTEGFTFTEINGLRRLCKNEKTRIARLASVVDLYKFGIKENPWDSVSAASLQNAHADFEQRVKGQDFAVTKTLDVVKRAVTGLAGLQHSSAGKPKGVLFYAGPTGTGKTETAKTLAERLFGDERCCIRFDMSEYGQSHSDQRLLGAPPGYVGYEAGGQLTNAIKETPFSILLFDEIEKAHPSILDKFLQILEDGRMTDGQGNTVYFSESIIIFTSNLGIFTRDESGARRANVTAEMDYATVQAKVRLAIEDFFKLELGRPEILNRIGENIVVFDFIRPPVAEIILDAQIAKICRNLKQEKRIGLELSPAARNVLRQKALGNLSNGARGIGNIVESLLINPLARFLFDNGIQNDENIEILEIDAETPPFELICKRSA